MHLSEHVFVLVALQAATMSVRAEPAPSAAFAPQIRSREYNKIDGGLFDLRINPQDHRTNSSSNSSSSSNSGSHAVNEYGEFQVIQSNVLRITSPSYKLQLRRTKREANATTPAQIAEPFSDGSDEQNTTELSVASDLSEERASGGKHDKKKKKKKKKKKGGLHGLIKKMKHWMPKFMHKMHGPSMFMLGMAQANFNNFVMHALMMSKMALVSVIMMIIREAVFGDKDQPVKYYNFGYEHPHPPRRHIPESYDYPYDYKRRRKRQT